MRLKIHHRDFLPSIKSILLASPAAQSPNPTTPTRDALAINKMKKLLSGDGFLERMRYYGKIEKRHSPFASHKKMITFRTLVGAGLNVVRTWRKRARWSANRFGARGTASAILRPNNNRDLKTDKNIHVRIWYFNESCWWWTTRTIEADRNSATTPLENAPWDQHCPETYS